MNFFSLISDTIVEPLWVGSPGKMAVIVLFAAARGTTIQRTVVLLFATTGIQTIETTIRVFVWFVLFLTFFPPFLTTGFADYGLQDALKG